MKLPAIALVLAAAVSYVDAQRVTSAFRCSTKYGPSAVTRVPTVSTVSTKTISAFKFQTETPTVTITPAAVLTTTTRDRDIDYRDDGDSHGRPINLHGANY
ncbi:hypothetical protein OPT61_g3654 [Boeremia exigua]|uniref:Uncharacterized protein n=1 Tax=Boeremia exigua TaxID=749465 RepID=A0ACC2IH75_9PLEO|nr:hypothetical protein OPT61_g3654 [Boeremia exigua]